MKASFLAILLALGFVAAAVAQEPPTANPPTTSEFADKAAVTNRFEIHAGQLAQEKTDDDTIEQYASLIVRDHKKALDQLKSVLEKTENVTVPNSLDQVHLSKLHALKMASGKQSKSTFKLQQVEGHKQAILLTEAYAQSGSNDRLRDWAAKALPVLRQHLAKAQQLPPSPDQPEVSERPAPPDEPDKDDDRP